MSDLETKVRGAASRLSPQWDDDRNRRVGLGLQHKKRRRERTRRAAGTVALAAFLLIGTLAGTGRLAVAAHAVKRWFAALVATPTEPTASEAALPSAAAPPPARVKVSGETPSGGDSVEPPAEVPTPAPIEAPIKAAPRTDSRDAGGRGDWRALAREQDFAKAYDAMKTAAKDVRDEPQDLLLASDVARLSNHPEEALDPLRRLVREHRSDSRAQLAAFTLGRVLLSDLKRPAEAADAFAEARSVSPSGPLAEDALARETEAAAAAGDGARARARAVEYAAKYPTGLRIESVKRWGGIR